MTNIFTTLQRLLRAISPRLFNDNVLRSRRIFWDGNRAKARKIAIYLIFPNHRPNYGVTDNHLYSLNYIIKMGYSPFVISNAPLRPIDIDRLRPLSWRIQQRQNFGYDFGGYRDAVLDLIDDLPYLDRLVFLNDSTWFPLTGRQNWLERAEQSGLDLYGANKFGDLVKPKADQFETAQWTVRPNAKKLHYGSFALSFGPAILRAKGFLVFWRRLRISGGKWRTIRRGEVGLSRWAIEAGFTHGSLSDYSQINLAKLPEFDRIWAEFLRNKTPFFEQFAPQNFTSRAQKEKFLEMAIAHLGAEYLLPRWFIETKGYPFLKKTTLAYNRDNLENLRLLLIDIAEPRAQQILAEGR
jgi:lipopolysaccharide biosynthesis protein